MRVAVGFNLRARAGKQRTDDIPALLHDRARAVERGTAAEVEEKRLDVIGRGMRQRDFRVVRLCQLLKERVALLSAAQLLADTALPRKRGNVAVTAEKRNVIFLTENFTEILVPLRFVAADAVMEVGGVERQVILFFYRILNPMLSSKNTPKWSFSP